MNSKITLQGLVARLAENAGVSKKKAEDFVREFTNLVVEGLESDGIVKIKQIGTFKLIEVEPRKSVDVNTGEDINIPGYTKMTFTASKELASRVNWPFEAFEAVELASQEEPIYSHETEDEPIYEEPIYDESDEPNETETDIIETVAGNDIDEPSVAEVPDNSESVEVSVETEAGDEAELVSEAEPVAETVTEPETETLSVAETLPETEAVSETETESYEESVSGNSECEHDAIENVESQAEKTDESGVDVAEAVEPAVTVREVSVRSDYEPDYEDYRDSRKVYGNHRFAWGFVVGFIASLIVVVLSVVIALYILKMPIGKVALQSAQEEQVEVVESDSDLYGVVPVEDSVELRKEEAPEVAAKSDTQTEDLSKAVDTKPTDEPVYDTITKTRYLTTMAKEHYGNYNLWPYIYEENKAFLGHPDRIRPGTRVVVPSLSKYGVDPSNPEDILKAKRKGVEIYSRYK